VSARSKHLGFERDEDEQETRNKKESAGSKPLGFERDEDEQETRK